MSAVLAYNQQCLKLFCRVYTPVREIFKQSLGMVYIARNRVTGEDVVIKLIERGPAITRHVANELVIHRKCTGHPFITQLIEVFLTPRHLAIVMEYVPGGDLLELINSRGKLSENEARWLFQQLVVGIAYLHSVGVNNREMKLSNKLLAPGEDETKPTLKIHDFLYNKSEQINSDPNSALDSLPYTAPELLNNTMQQGTAADIWSLGVALYKLTTGIYPFERPEDVGKRNTVQAVLGRIARVEYTIPDSLSPELRDLLTRMLWRNPSERITLTDIVKHPWFLRDLPAGLLDMNARPDLPAAPVQDEAEFLAVIQEAQEYIRPFDSENVDAMADEILNEEEADDLLEELTLMS